MADPSGSRQERATTRQLRMDFLSAVTTATAQRRRISRGHSPPPGLDALTPAGVCDQPRNLRRTSRIREVAFDPSLRSRCARWHRGHVRRLHARFV